MLTRALAIVAPLLLASASAFAEETSPIDIPMACYGSEPFWSLTMPNRSTAHFKDDLGEHDFKIKGITNAMMRPSTWRVTFEGNRHAYIYDEGPKGCVDSDSDQPPPYGLILDLNGGVLRGCCSPAR